jgi:serine/threonine-protein kinase RsbT
MRLIHTETHPIIDESDMLLVRQAVHKHASDLGFGALRQIKALTAVSELARNTLIHGGGGELLLETFAKMDRRCLRLTFEDQGPGIPDIDQALQEGYSTAGGLGLGLGLSGTKRLVDEFAIDSSVGNGTRVTVMLCT